MKETKKGIFDPKAFFLRTLTDPILWYTALIMAALMFHYRDREEEDWHGYIFAAVWGVVTYVAGWLIFRVFDYMQKHHIIGFGMYIALAALFGVGVRYSIEMGREDYPIEWMLWFLTPQDSVDYNFGYTLGFYLLFLLFMASVIYYFTRVRYRIFMNFLIFIIPFAIYGKEYEKMPTLLIILLTVGYILLMVYYRQLSDSEDTVFVDRRHSLLPIAAYAVIFAGAAAIIPKPEIEADRSYIETLINAEQFTDKLVNMLNAFRDTSSGQQFRSTQNTVVYEAVSDDDLRIKTETFSTYNFNNDTWSIEEVDNVFGERTDDNTLNIGSRMGMADAFLEAARLDSDYAEKYGLTEFVNSGLDVPELKRVFFYSMNGIIGFSSGASTAPVPQFAVRMNYCTRRGKMTRLRGGTVYAIDSSFTSSENFGFEYSADTFFLSNKNLSFIDQIAKSDYRQLLDDTFDVLSYAYWRDSSDNEDFEQIYDYFGIDYELYDEYLDKHLNYGKNARIKALADSITEGCDTEYEKALALERYFYDHDYNYDLSYKKKVGENAEDFLFETKTGVCYEYATSMVLLARAAGIPARYCEGYNMTKQGTSRINERANYYVTTQDAHGFPELYIRGYGWVSFEPTVTDAVAVTDKKSATDMLSRAGIMILAAALLVLLFSFVYPWLSHKIFIIRGRKRSPKDTVKAVMHRICKVYGIENVNTSQEVCGLVHEAAGADITETALLFDRAVYGEQMLDEHEKEKALEEYIKAYDSYREAKKRRGITNR